MTARELVELDAVELIWNCLDDVDSQPTIYVVQSTSTTGRHHSRRRHLHSTDIVDTGTWRVIAEVSLHASSSDNKRGAFISATSKPPPLA